MITVIIPFKDRELWRLRETIRYAKSGLVSEIIVVDYNSKKPVVIKDQGVKVIRYDRDGPWNKAHAINIGVKAAQTDFIMTLDADILLAPTFYGTLEPFLVENNFIYSKEVRRIDKNVLKQDWESMIGSSAPWSNATSYFEEMGHTGTGGVQIYPKSWFMDNRGIDENLFYYGGMDNITLCDARNAGLNLVMLQESILHIEHDKKKESNMPPAEQDFAKFVRSDRGRLLNSMLMSDEKNNEGFFGELNGPNMPLFQEYANAYKLKLQEIEQSEMKGSDTEICLPQHDNIKIMIVPINNTCTYPVYFADSMYGVLDYTRQVFKNTEIININACDVNHLRNVAIDLAIKNNYDYLVQLDIDHVYPKDFILRLLAHDKEFITGLTMNRTLPQTLTQFKKLRPAHEMTRTNDNQVVPDGTVQKIEATGPVGMLMKVSTLRMLPRPWFRMEYYGETATPMDSGGDFHFCKLLKQFGKEIYCDTSMEFPHHNTVQIAQKGISLTTTGEYAEWEKRNKKKFYIPVPEVPEDL